MKIHFFKYIDLFVTTTMVDFSILSHSSHFNILLISFCTNVIKNSVTFIIIFFKKIVFNNMFSIGGGYDIKFIFKFKFGWSINNLDKDFTSTH